MKYFGPISDNKDLVDKAYVDALFGSGAFDSNATITALDPTYSNHLVILDRSVNSIGFSSMPSAGDTFHVYIRASVDNAHLQIPSTINSKICILDGLFPDTTNDIVIRVTKGEKEGEDEITLMTGVTLHIFYDGTVFYVNRHYYTSST